MLWKHMLLTHLSAAWLEQFCAPDRSSAGQLVERCSLCFSFFWDWWATSCVFCSWKWQWCKGHPPSLCVCHGRVADLNHMARFKIKGAGGTCSARHVALARLGVRSATTRAEVLGVRTPSDTLLPSPHTMWRFQAYCCRNIWSGETRWYLAGFCLQSHWRDRNIFKEKIRGSRQQVNGIGRQCSQEHLETGRGHWSVPSFLWVPGRNPGVRAGSSP